MVEQIIKEEMTAEQLKNQAADSDDDGTSLGTGWGLWVGWSLLAGLGF